jgi:hypothetical protein
LKKHKKPFDSEQCDQQYRYKKKRCLVFFYENII